MDPITHTVLGAASAHVLTSKKLGRGALLFGAAGGFLPDADVLWGPLISDLALPWEYHRHFTHALAFIPIGGAIAAGLLLLMIKRFRPTAGWAYLAATIGWATHGVNDALTSFGTFLYWPFSTERVAWDVISVIDPLFTLPLILGVMLVIFLNRAWPAQIGLAVAVAYLTLGCVQNQRVLAVQEKLAQSRGHVVERGRAMPTMANILIWRSIYEYDGSLYADAVRASLFGRVLVREGESIRRFTFDDLPPEARNHERINRVFRSFEDFADGYVAVARESSGALVLGDMRYSLDAARFEPLWGIRINPPNAPGPAEWVNMSAESPDARREALSRLWREMTDPGEVYVPLERWQ